LTRFPHWTFDYAFAKISPRRGREFAIPARHNQHLWDRMSIEVWVAASELRATTGAAHFGSNPRKPAFGIQA
jgi:hypothetical protein